MLGDNIRKYRKENNISQEKLAEELDVTRQSISLWENNQTQPSLENIVALAKIFKVTTDDLLSDETKVGKSTKNNTSSRKATKKHMLLTLVAMCVIFVVIALLFFKSWSNGSIISPKPFSEDVDAIAEKESSVVKVFCYDHNGKEISTGSGVVLFHNDMVVTNYHVIKDTYSVKISTEQDITYKVSGLWHENEKQDIAILKLERSTDLNPLEIGDSSAVKKGETVTAIGSPLGIKNTVSKGNLSARIMQDNYDILQFTAPISNGSSGGALFNEKGEVIGITFASFIDGQNLNLAIPVEMVKELYESKRGTVVSFKELKNSPEKYCNKKITVIAYVSSVDYIRKMRMGLYITEEPSKSDILKDSRTYLNEEYNKHNLIKISTYKGLSSDDAGVSDDVETNPLDKVLISGVFKIDASGNYIIKASEIEVL